MIDASRNGGVFLYLAYKQTILMIQNETIDNSQRNWYIAEIIVKCEPVNNTGTDLRRVSVWGNNFLLKANSAEEAYEKAIAIGKKDDYKFINSDKIEMQSVFLGLGNLTIVTDDTIGDGMELHWTDYGDISNKRSKVFPLSKDELIAGAKE